MTRYLVCLLIAFTLIAAERERTPEEAAALAAGGDLPEEMPERPATLPDLTKGETIPLPKEGGPITWNMGPTGIIGIKNGGFAGDQVQVIAVLPGSPAAGKVLPGDVVLGVQGVNFKPGGHLGVQVGNAIIKAEEEAGKGVLQFHLWRDRNWAKRNSAKDIAGVDIEQLFKEAEGGADLYDWKDEAAKQVDVKQASFDAAPIEGAELDVTLQLNVMGSYSETSPYDCPVAAAIREGAWKYLEKRFEPDARGRVPANTLDVIALVASGKPEHRELVKKWIRSKDDKAWAPDRKISLTGGGMMSWHMGFDGLEAAIYYDATGDDYVVPALREMAVKTAMGQNGGGSWGHTFAFPTFNGGMLHMRNPGYGAMNNAGGRCFFMLALADKNGIKDPEITAAIGRSAHFFRTYVDKGCVPYGFHPPAGSDDSNGKNYGPAYAFFVLGDKYPAKYYAQLSTHASFSRRGGHGSPNLWHYTPLSANICGPEGTQATMRNMRWFYTLARRHDGSFVMQGEQAGIGGKPARSPTATYALHYSAPLKQTVITGKDADPSIWHSEKDMAQLLVSALPQLNDPTLIKQVGTPWIERSSDELLNLLDHFFPNMRRAVAAELGKRVAAGDTAIVAKVVELLKHEEPRFREGACLTLQACGDDTILRALSKITPLLDDPNEFVRMAAVSTMAKATGYDANARYTALFEAAAKNYDDMTMDHGNVRNIVKGTLFGKGAANPFITAPFDSAVNPDIMQRALEGLVMMDPGGTVSTGWSQDTVIRLAGPLTYVADEIQLNDAMFGFARTGASRTLLAKYGYRECIEGSGNALLKRQLLRRDVRLVVNFKASYIEPSIVSKYRGACGMMIEPMRDLLLDNPVAAISEKVGKTTVTMLVADALESIEADKGAKQLPSIGGEAGQRFEAELAAAGSSGAKIKLCRAELKEPARRRFFREMSAMTALADLLGPDAIDDIIPFLGDEQWRLRQHAHALAVKLAKGGADARLIEVLPQAAPKTAAAILPVLAEAGKGLDAVRSAVKRSDSAVQKAAVEALVALAGDAAFDEVMALLADTVDPDILWGCENALLSRREDPAYAKRLQEAAIRMLPNSRPEVRGTLYWLLAQLGGPESYTVLKSAAKAADKSEQAVIINALSYAPERAADDLMLALARADKRLAAAVAHEAVRRMVVGPKGVNDITDTQRVNFARQMLEIQHDDRLITYLSSVNTGPAIQLLLDTMKRGSTELAAGCIIAAADGMVNPPAKDAKMAAEALTQVIEYIEVTRLRGGVSAHMNKDDKYPEWKARQALAGKILLRLHKPETAPIPTFDDNDLGL